MKMMKDVDILKCDFAADIVPYMYGEMSRAGISAFESHLLECDECTDELAAVSFARYEVYDWKKLEFDPLPTPRMLPFEDTVTVQASTSWFDGLRAALSGRLVPSSGLAGIAIAVIAVGAMYFSARDEPAVSQAEVSPPTASSPVPSPDVAPALAAIEPNDEPQVAEAVARTGARRRAPQAKPTRVAKANTVVRPVPAVATTVPRLNEFSDDEDTSLRLAQLFEDVDTRD